MKYIYPTLLGHVGLEYICFCRSISKGLEFIAWVFPPSRGRRPLQIKNTYPTSLRQVGSEYVWLCMSISKRLEVIALVLLLLQE